MVANQLYELCEAVGPEPTRSVQIRSFKYYKSYETLLLWHWPFSMAFEECLPLHSSLFSVVVTMAF